MTAPKVLQSVSEPRAYALYRAALEWGLEDPIVIEGRDDLKSEYRWSGRIEPYHHQVNNLITFCRRLPVTLLAAKLVRPDNPNKTKLMPYECGIDPIDSSRGRYTVRYYIIAILFVVFDVETIFLFPWAVKFKLFGLFGLIEMLVFLAILIVGYIWIWGKGALEWV